MARAAASAAESSKLAPLMPPPFLSKTYEMVDDPATDAVVSWGPGGSSFVVWSPPELERVLLPKYFKHRNFASFVRQLNTYGFKKVDPDKYEFVNEGFVKGQKHLLKSIKRKQPIHGQNQPDQPTEQDASATACIEVGKCGLEEEIEGLKRDKNILKQELVRLKQHQQNTDSQLQTLGQSMCGMERRQQQMMSFLAKAMQSPGVVAQLVQQNDNRRCIDARNRKRRMHNQDDILDGKQAPADCQIIKYQPLMIEAAKEILVQLLEMNLSPRLSKSNGLPPVALDSPSSASLSMGVSLEEAISSTTFPYITATSKSSDISTLAVSEVHSSLGGMDMIASSTLPDKCLISATPQYNSPCQTDSIPGFTQMQVEISDGNSSDISCFGCAVPEAEKAYADTIFSGIDDRMSMEAQNFPADVDSNSMYDEGDNSCFGCAVPEAEKAYADAILSGIDDRMAMEVQNFPTDVDSNSMYDEGEKLPISVDSFWEQFLEPNEVSCDSDELDPGLDVMEEVYTGQENSWDYAQNMARLRDQLGLLASDIKTGFQESDSFSQHGPCSPSLADQNLTFNSGKHGESKVGTCWSSFAPQRPSTCSTYEEIVPLSGNPYFTFIISKTHFSKTSEVVVPKRFHPLLPSTTVAATLTYGNKIWDAKYYGRRRLKRIGSGWRCFMIDNCLKLGDGCVLELMEGTKPKFKVSLLDGKIPREAISHIDGDSYDNPISID